MCGARACATHCIARSRRPLARSFVRYLQAATAGMQPLVFLRRREIPEGRVRFVLLRPPRARRQTKSHFICRRRQARQLHMYDVRVASVYLIVRSGAICTSPPRCRSWSWSWAGWGPGRTEQSTFRRVVRWTRMSVGRPSRMIVTPVALTDAQLHLFRKRKTNALYFRESDRQRWIVVLGSQRARARTRARIP